MCHLRTLRKFLDHKNKFTGKLVVFNSCNNDNGIKSYNHFMLQKYKFNCCKHCIYYNLILYV